MNCPKCGSALISGMDRCVCCGAPLNEPIPTNNKHSASGRVASSVHRATSHTSDYLTALSEFPGMLKRSMTEPGELLREMVMKRDFYTPTVVAVLVLLGSFICGIVMSRSVVNVLFSLLSVILGANKNTATTEGITLIAASARLPSGGVVLLCQAVAMVLHTVVYLFFICKKCHVEFSWELALDFMAVVSLVTVAAEILALLLSLWSPYASLLVIILGVAVSQLQSCGMLSLITSIPDEKLFKGKLWCICIAVLLTAVVSFVIGNAMVGPIWKKIILKIATMVNGL